VAENLPFKESEFDFVLLITTICFLDDVEKSFNKVHRILNYNGNIIIGIIDRDSPIGKLELAQIKFEKMFFIKKHDFIQ
jgi:ubiquinone/menaquinone biosynthesis C-methylase UbiE